MFTGRRSTSVGRRFLKSAKLRYPDADFDETIYDQAVTDMIMHGVTDEAWDSMINSLKAAGADRYVEIYQNAYDEYLAKQ